MVLVVTAIFAASDTMQVLGIPARWLSLIALVIFAALIYWVMFGLYQELHRIKTSVPRLLLSKIEPSIKDVAKIETFTGDDGVNRTRLVGVPTFTRIWIANQPLLPELGVDAEGVHAEIVFRSESGESPIAMSGRWSEVEESHDNLKTEQVPILPNGKPLPLT